MRLVQNSALHMVGAKQYEDNSVKRRSRSCWESLLHLAREDMNADHVKELLAEEKERLEDYTKIKRQSGKTKGTGFLKGIVDSTNFLHMEFTLGPKDVPKSSVSKRMGDIREPVGAQERVQLYQILTAQSMLIKQHRMETVQNTKGPKGSREDEGFNILRDLKSYRKILILQALYSTMLGSSFRYKFGIQKAEFDLFLW